MKFISKNIFLLLLIVFPFYITATIIIPPSDFGEMIDQTEFIVFGEVMEKSIGDRTINSFRVIDNLKGNLGGQQIINIEEYVYRSGDMITSVTGDVSFEVGKKYLVFLWKNDSGNYKPALLALSVYEEGIKDNETILAHPFQMHQECFVGAVDHELSGGYSKVKMIEQIKSIIKAPRAWNKFDAGFIDAERPIENEHKSSEHKDHKSVCPNTPPSHCTTLFGSPGSLNGSCTSSSPGKFMSPVFTIKVATGGQNVPPTTGELNNLTNAINSLDGLPGLTVQEANPLSQTCSVPSTPCSVQNISFNCSSFNNEFWVFFNDPCNEISPLNGCAGVLGLGGTWSFSNCHTDACGNQWKSNGRPYFVMNDGTTCLNDYSYTATLIHEMMHGLGLGHIGSGMPCSAIMNPIVCNSNPGNNVPNYGITNLDEQCIDWMYNIGNTSCTITNFINVNQPVCSGTDVEFDIEFDVVGGSGNYDIIAGTTVIHTFSGVTSGTINENFVTTISPGTVSLSVEDANDASCDASINGIVIPDCSCSISNLQLTSGPSCSGNNINFSIQFTTNNSSGNYVIDLGGNSLGTIASTSGSFTVADNQGTQLLTVTDQLDPACSDNLSLVIQDCPTCNDGIQNGGETGIDCGGQCPPCPTCNDGIQNGDESGIDCGGSVCGLCDCTDNDDLTYSNTTIPNGTDEYVNDWIKTQGTVDINNGSTIELRTGTFIELMPGFEIKTNSSGSVLLDIEGCIPN